MIFKLHIHSTLEALPVALNLQYQGTLVTVYHPLFPNRSSAHSGIPHYLLRMENIRGLGLVGCLGMTQMVSLYMASQDTNFFYPATYAQFYLDQNPPFPHNGGRLSVLKDSDVQSTGGNGHQNRHAIKISVVMEDSFTMMPFTVGKSTMEESIPPSLMKGFKTQETQATLSSLKSLRLDPGPVGKEAHSLVPICQGYEGML
ncbi:hypothetical protein SESBI_32000 [Sesbania bispinosa]|nr:hypothetical protein SESBI_32000 [Sesbania bispinosa]